LEGYLDNENSDDSDDCKRVIDIIKKEQKKINKMSIGHLKQVNQIFIEMNKLDLSRLSYSFLMYLSYEVGESMGVLQTCPDKYKTTTGYSHTRDRFEAIKKQLLEEAKRRDDALEEK